MKYNAFGSSYEVSHSSRMRRSIHFAKRHHKKALLILVGAIITTCIASVVVQLIYPNDRSLPATRLAGSFLTFQDTTVVKKQLARYDQQSFTLTVGTDKETITPAKVGMTYVNDDNVHQVFSYPFVARLIPFSLFFQNKTFIQGNLKPTINASTLQAYADALSSKNNSKPIEGVITIENGKVIEHPPQPGHAFTADEITSHLKAMTASIPANVTVPGRSIPPIYTAEAVHIAATKATSLIHPVVLTVSGTDFTIPAETVGSWLQFTADPTTKTITIGTDVAATKSYLDTIAKKLYRAPTTTSVTLLDSQEVDRQVGAAGSYFDTTTAATTLGTSVTSGQSSLTVAMKPVSSPINYVRTYSNSQAGLQALLDYLVSSKGEYGISVHEMSARGWTASSNGAKDFVTASTYKLFVAYSTLLRIENGTFDWSDPTGNTDMTTCFSRMIVNSDNDCAQALGVRVGWDTVFSEANSLGLGNTYQGSDTFHSTANDESLFLQKLSAGEILTPTDQALLLNLMSQQIYRQGIPAGVGVPVSDRVGFLWGYLNDAAIVYSPSSTYVLVILTNNSSWSQIADTARQIQTQMAR
jgi:beta-lactamase class A